MTDPWETLDHAKDTTLRLIEESLRLGVESHWTDVRSIRATEGRILLDARRVTAVAPGRSADAFSMEAPAAVSPDLYTSIIYRTDPPVDLAYLHPLQLLTLGIRGAKRTKIVNPAEVLALRGEKIEAMSLGTLCPSGAVSSRLEDLESFGRKMGRAVLKPLHEAQSKGVELLDWRTRAGALNARGRLKTLSHGFTQPVLLQEYREEILDGETRAWFLDGKLLAAVRKHPRSGEFRIDMDRGGTLGPAKLTTLEKRAIPRIGNHLRSLGIRLAAVDLIGGLVTDFNHTSPGLLTPMETIVGRNLAEPIIRSLAR